MTAGPDSMPRDDIVCSISCRPLDGNGRGTRHPVRIAPDWQLSTPHDIDAERIAVALGGTGTTCVKLLRAVAAAHALTDFRSRTRPVPVERAGPAEWRVTSRRVRRPSSVFGSVFAAVADANSIEDAATRYRALNWQVAELAGVTRRWADAVSLSSDALRRPHDAVLEPDGLRLLWDAGVHPDRIPTLRRLVRAGNDQLSAYDYIELAYTSIGFRGVRRIREHVGGVEATIDVLRLGARGLPAYLTAIGAR